MNVDVTKNHWDEDIRAMHAKFKVREVVSQMDREKMLKFLEFRINFLQEELDEAKLAMTVLNDVEIDTPDRSSQVEAAADDLVDSMIDLCVVAIGTLDAFGINAHVSWNRVHQANMAKEVGIKKERPNPLGLPDLIKPVGWKAPVHTDNIGLLRNL